MKFLSSEIVVWSCMQSKIEIICHCRSPDHFQITSIAKRHQYDEFFVHVTAQLIE